MILAALLLIASTPEAPPTPEHCWEIREIAIEAGMDSIQVQQLFTRCRNHK